MFSRIARAGGAPEIVLISLGGTVAELAKRFVPPSVMRRGIGRAMFNSEKGSARAAEANWRLSVAGPGALPFYISLDGEVRCALRHHPRSVAAASPARLALILPDLRSGDGMGRLRIPAGISWVGYHGRTSLQE
jgi:hypothetical protein